MDSNELSKQLHLIALGDQQAFQRFYQLTAAKLYSVSLAILREKELAEDVLQDTYIKVWHRAADYRPDRGSVMSWVTSMTRYRAIDELRSSNYKAVTVDDIEQLLNRQHGASELTPATDTERLDGCLNELKESHRQSIHLAYLFGLTHREISNYLGQALGSVKTWIRRGLDSLKRCLQS